MKKILLLLFVSLALSQWSSEPDSPQLLGSGVQAQVKATSDGGVYVAWLTDMGGYHVYLQRFNSEGVAQFEDGGMLISDNSNASWIAVFHMNLDVDSENNAIITVLDERSGPWNVYAYKIAPDGSLIWGDDGLALSSSNNTNYSPRLAVFPDNSVVVTWSVEDSAVRFQRISADGNLMWGDGILIEGVLGASLMSPQPIINADGDALIQWIHQTGPFWAADSEVYLQKYNLEGNPLWNEPTVVAGPVVFPMGNWSQQSISDGISGSYSAWTRMSGNVQSATTQHVMGDGAVSWAGGVNFSTNTSSFHISPRLAISENSQQLMAVWNESNGSQSQRGVYAQRLDENGNRLWGFAGLPVVPLNNNFDYLDLSIAAVEEGLITVYCQQSTNMSGDIYATLLDANGNFTWEGEVEITNSGNPKSDVMMGKGQESVYIAWTENGNVYAHCLKEDGTLGAADSYILGDVNADEQINVLDVVAIIGFIVGPNSPSESELLAGDYNEDGALNVLDVVAIVALIINS